MNRSDRQFHLSGSFHRLLLILLLIGCCGSSAALTLKDPKPHFRSFSVAHGLPSSEVYFVHQDRKGFMWFCTDRGVVRYDGYRFTVFTENNGLADNVVFYIYEDFKGRLWFVSMKPKLCYYEYKPGGTEGNLRLYKYNSLIDRTLRGYNTSSKDLYIDPRNGDLTYSVYNTSAFRISETGKITIVAPFEKAHAELWEADGTAHFISTVDVLNRGVKSDKLTPLHYRRGNALNVFPEGIHVLNGLRVTMHNNLLFYATNNGMGMIWKKKIVQLIRNEPVIGMNSVDDYLWVGIYGKGAYKYRLDPQTGELHETDHLFDHLSVTSVARDNEGGYWFSTLEDGVKYVPYIGVRHYTEREGLLSAYISAVDGIRNEVYVVCNYRTLQKLGKPSWAVSSTNHYNFGIAAFNGELLVTGCNELPRTSKNDCARVIPYSGNTKRISVSKDHYVICRFGVGRFDRSHHETELMVRGDQRPYFKSKIVMEDKYGTIYLANELGLVRLHGDRLVPVTFGGLLRDVRVEDALDHPFYGSIIVTRGKGLVFFDGDSVTGQLTMKDGLLNDQLNFCYVDARNRLWVGSNKGLNCIVKKNGSYAIRQFTIRNGLLTNEVNGLYEYNNRIWVATKKGITVIDLDNPSGTKEPSGVYLAEILDSDGKKITQRSPVFASGTTFVKLVLRTTNYRGAPFHRFRYRFSSESKWAVAVEPEITLNNPKHGDYRFELSYLDEDGNWSAPRLVCVFAIESPFYLRWYFIAGLILLGAGLGFLLFRLRIRQLSRRHKLQKTISQLEQKALRAQMNPHFIFNSLNSIQSFLMYEENEKAERYLLKFAQLIRQTLNNSRESYITIEAEMETLRRYLDLEQMRFKDKFTFAITCKLTHEELGHGVPPMLIQPFVENAVLHGFRSVESGGRIDVVFESLSNGHLLCTVEDNGVGRKMTLKNRTEGHKSFGTKITAERLEAFREKYGDDFTIETIDLYAGDQPAGTRVILHIPVVSPNEFNATDEA